MPNFNGTSTGNDMQCINQNSDGSYEGTDCNGKELTQLSFPLHCNYGNGALTIHIETKTNSNFSGCRICNFSYDILHSLCVDLRPLETPLSHHDIDNVTKRAQTDNKIIKIFCSHHIWSLKIFSIIQNINMLT